MIQEIGGGGCGGGGGEGGGWFDVAKSEVQKNFQVLHEKFRP